MTSVDACINGKVRAFLRHGDPVISVDTKKKELVGQFKNTGQEWNPQGQPVRVKVHDFKDPVLGKAVPYGIYDLGRNHGWVEVGIDHDTAAFAVAAIRAWWHGDGAPALRVPTMTSALLTAGLPATTRSCPRRPGQAGRAGDGPLGEDALLCSCDWRTSA